ncbi:histidine phosphatase family protein [Shewanella sp. TC10]|uniref:histidine phosphatase family protein n=1 Tax=Shewanella sp. TC10 TaxID=1419739 RepID=UPI00129EF971|nr:histidine phosphatase family protein [Shewanella sp. TC10]
MTVITLLRHGQPHSHECLLGHTDSPITDFGWQQLQCASQDTGCDLVVSSPLRRCCDFAKTYAKSNSLPFVVDERFQEMNFGDWDGLPLAHLWESELGYNEFWAQPWLQTPPNGESSLALYQRVIDGLSDLIASYPSQHILLFTHGGVMRIVMAWILGTQQQGNMHLSQLSLGYASKIKLDIYIDPTGKQWPQLVAIMPSPISKTAKESA